MAKVDTPDIKYGFWVALGAILALMVASMVRSLISRASSRGNG